MGSYLNANARKLVSIVSLKMVFSRIEKFVCVYFQSIHLKNICISDALRDLVPCVQFKKRGKHPWGSVTFSKVFTRKYLVRTHCKYLGMTRVASF